jgi:MoaA/NifB/PqqE/SkfB family radical SAM enzyme
MWGPFLAQMVVTRRCNIDCGYCNEYDKTSAPVPFERLKQQVDHLNELSCAVIEFTGGETLLHPDLLPLIRYASERSFYERWIITNGYLLSAPIVEGLNDAGLTNMQISIDGLTPNTTTVKVLKPLRKKLDMLAEKARFRVQVNAVLGAGNGDEVLEVARTARELGFIARVSVIHDHTGSMSLDEKGRALLSELHQTVGQKWEESGNYRHRLMTEGSAPFHCRAGSRYLYIDEHGLVNWCSQQRGVFTKPFLEYGWADLKEQFYTVKDCAPTCTLGCVRTASRFDEWRDQDLVPEMVHKAPARNEGELIPVAKLLNRAPEKTKRSQRDWRRQVEG